MGNNIRHAMAKWHQKNAEKEEEEEEDKIEYLEKSEQAAKEVVDTWEKKKFGTKYPKEIPSDGRVYVMAGTSCTFDVDQEDRKSAEEMCQLLRIAMDLSGGGAYAPRLRFQVRTPSWFVGMTIPQGKVDPPLIYMILEYFIVKV